MVALFWKILVSERGPDMYYFKNILNLQQLGDNSLGPIYHVTADEAINCNSTSTSIGGLGSVTDGTISYSVDYLSNVVSESLTLSETIAFTNCKITGDLSVMGGGAMSTLVIDGTLNLNYEMPSNIEPTLDDYGTITGQITVAGDLDGNSMTNDPFWSGTLNINRYWIGTVQDWRQTPPVPAVTLGRSGGVCLDSTVVSGGNSMSDLDDTCSDASEIIRPVF